MPTYEYRCTDCDHTFDAVQAFSDDALTECPECGGRLKKLFGNVGIAFKGSGFYETDYRSESYKADAKKETDATTSKPTPAATTDTGGSAGSGTTSTSSGSGNNGSKSKE